MMHCLDSAIGNVTAALSAKGMWEKTLVVFSADNGGREDAQFGGNNFPLRGMKFTAFEGGVRVASFVSGGALPAARRGQTATGTLSLSLSLSLSRSLSLSFSLSLRLSPCTQD